MQMFKDRVGDHDDRGGQEAPRTSARRCTCVDHINRPLLIGQGANDPRVKQAEADQIVKAMQKKKIPVTYVLFPDEGHGFPRPENRLAFNAVTEAFLAEHLGGRYEPIGDAFPRLDHHGADRRGAGAQPAGSAGGACKEVGRSRALGIGPATGCSCHFYESLLRVKLRVEEFFNAAGNPSLLFEHRPLPSPSGWFEIAKAALSAFGLDGLSVCPSGTRAHLRNAGSRR